MTTNQILRVARCRLSDPHGWCKDSGYRDGPRCVGLTLSDLGDYTYEAYAALGRAIGAADPEDISEVYAWNDDPATTHADVLAALDRAIEATA